MNYSCLLIDSDTQATGPLSALLRQELDVEVCELAQQALDRLHAKPFNLAVLDSDLPDMPGMSLLRVLRATEFGKNLPIIFVSAKKTEESVANAFGFGVDDYLTKPYDPRELQARIHAVLRRKYERLEQWGIALSVAGVDIDPSQRRCVVDGKRVDLRPLEFELLETFMRRAGRVLSRPYLLESVWKMDTSANTRVVDVMVSRLRRALGKDHGRLIETVSKMGYCFRVPESK